MSALTSCEKCRDYGVNCWEETGRKGWLGIKLPDRSGIVVDGINTGMTQEIDKCAGEKGKLSPEQQAKAIRETLEIITIAIGNLPYYR